jgi:hypothetical protein
MLCACAGYAESRMRAPVQRRTSHSGRSSDRPSLLLGLVYLFWVFTALVAALAVLLALAAVS